PLRCSRSPILPFFSPSSFFFNATPTTEFYTLSLHDALPISAYGRSGFIHPLWSPKGQVLTRVQPEDHYHHYGIWNPWTQLNYEGDRKSTRLNSSHVKISYAVFCLKKKKKLKPTQQHSEPAEQ